MPASIGFFGSATARDEFGQLIRAEDSFPRVIVETITAERASDTEPPTVAATVSPDPVNGWSTVPATVNLTAADNMGVSRINYSFVNGVASAGSIQADASGVLLLAGAVQITREGRTTMNYWTVDEAGNASPEQQITVRVDRTPPVPTTARISPPADATGWHHTDVTIGITVQDFVSGPARNNPSHVLITREGVALQDTVPVFDEAGNHALYTSPPVNIDKTPPSGHLLGDAVDSSVVAQSQARADRSHRAGDGRSFRAGRLRARQRDEQRAR